MNIFRLDETPDGSAFLMCDVHVNKMVLETCQILACGFSLERLSANDCPRTKDGKARKHFNPKHPSCLWALESQYNFDWLIQHAISLEHERMKRGMNPHFVRSFIKWVMKYCDDAENVGHSHRETPFKVAIKDDCKCRQVEGFDTAHYTSQYMLYYKYDKPFAKWKYGTPAFMGWEDEEILKQG
jgi:hypothetical protein